MVLFRTRIRVDAACRSKVIRSLAGIMGPLRASCGCVSCHLYADLEDDQALMYVEEWEDEQSLIEHLRADNTRVLLSALDCASDPPEIRLDTLAHTRGIEFIATCRETDLCED
jgi:quinol monooxygenase YgiN